MASTGKGILLMIVSMKSEAVSEVALVRTSNKLRWTHLSRQFLEIVRTLLNALTRNLISLRLIKRRTKPMEIVAGENACYTLLAFICLKMEVHWKSNPIGKVRNNLPFFKSMA